MDTSLRYRPDRLVWLEMGGVYTIPCIRGGDEYGDELTFLLKALKLDGSVVK